MGPYSEEAKRSYEFARRVLSKIIKHPSPYLSSKDLKDLDIRCTGLDLETGKPTDGGVAFISPYPLTEIDRILHETKPWKLRKLPPKKDSMNMCAAMEIWGLLEEYLVMAEDKKVEGLIEQTKWKTRRPIIKNCERLYRRDEQADWEVPYVFDMLDPSTSHISCFLADNAPLRDDHLSVSEIWCVIAITAGRLRLLDYRIHGLFPVTVISAASRKLRIVQAYIDDEQGCIRVRKSQIIDFEKEDLRTTELVLSWVIGNPVGNTRR